MTSQTIAPTTERVRRPSKFIEGLPLTGPDLQTPASNEHFLTILSEMDEFERKRQLRGSNSVDSLVSPNGSPVKESRKSFSEREERRSLGFSRPNLNVVRGAFEEKKSSKFVGRLRALTGGRDREENGTSYLGTT